jgi:peroxiredoxin
MRYARFKIPFLVAFSCALFVTSVPAATVRAGLTSLSSRATARPFSLTDNSGRTEQLADYRGRVVLLNFWATDCGGCRLEIPWLVNLDKTFKNKRVAVIGISLDISYEDLKNADEAWSRVKPFVETHQITYPIVMGDGEVSKRYRTEALPASYLIDTRGRIAATYVGLIDEKNVEANIKTLLTEDQVVGQSTPWHFEKADRADGASPHRDLRKIL